MIFGRRYRVTEKIGSGGMAEVYKAVDETLGRTVAVKVMHAHYAGDPEFVARFRREAASAANLQHPGIVNIYDFGTEDGTPYIVMEYVRGTDLKSVVRRQGALDPLKVAEYGAQVCSALAAAHGYGIVHRDIKPHNIVLMPDGRIKVMDFGIARAVDSDATQTGSVLGTAQYVSPEQAQGRPLAGQTDLYSLGVVLYELSTGRLPFDGDTPVSVALKHVNDPVTPPRRVNAAIPPALDAVIMKALEKDPARRYHSADEMRDDLLKVASGRPVSAAAVAAAADEDHTRVMPVVPATPSEDREFVSRRSARPPRGTNPWVWLGVIALVLLAALAAAWAMGLFNGQTRVPDVAGLTQAEAVTAITDAGLKVGNIDARPDEAVEASRVIQTDPPTGQAVDPGTMVDLVVSSGPPMVKMPKVVGVELDKALATLQDQGFTVDANAVQEEFNATVAAGLVSFQDPTAGVMVRKGTTVVLRVSKGVEKATVPDVTDSPRAEAEAELKAAGFLVKVSKKASNTVANGVVMDQTPNGGATAPKGSTVTIVVSTGPDKVKVPDLTGKTQDQATQLLTDAGLEGNPLTIAASDPSQIGTVVEQAPPPLTSVNRGTTVTFYVAVAP